MKRNAKGHMKSWIGYKLRIDAAEGGIPLGGLLTLASLHDSQAAIPMAAQTGQRVTYLYELMDAACDAPKIRSCSERTGHIGIVDTNPAATRRSSKPAAGSEGATRGQRPGCWAGPLRRMLEYRMGQRTPA